MVGHHNIVIILCGFRVSGTVYQLSKIYNGRLLYNDNEKYKL